MEVLINESDNDFIKSYADGTEPIELDALWDTVNQSTSSGCSCCKREVRAYAVHNWITKIKQEILSLCVECARKLPVKLELINLYANGVPVAIRVKI